MKYIMYRRRMDQHLCHYVPVVFPASLVHADVNSFFIAQPAMIGYEAVSAGECNVGLGATCHGRSTTMGLKSDPERDGNIIAMNDYGSCFVDEPI